MFFEESDGTLDTDRLLYEAVPLAQLVAVVAAVALVPVFLQMVVVEALGLTPWLHGLLGFASQFVLAVGAGLVLLYVVVRGTRIAGE